MGVYQCIFKVIGGKRGVRMRIVNCGGVRVGVDRQRWDGMGKVFQLVILQALYSLGRD